MSMIEIDENAREILRDWKMIFSQQERLHVDYSEAIRIAANKINNLENKIIDDRILIGEREKCANEFVEIRLPQFNEMEKIQLDKINALSDGIKAVYFLLQNKCIMYVGITNNLKKRISCHKELKRFNEIYYIKVDSRLEREIIERYCISKFKPILNGLGNEKQYPFGYEKNNLIVYPAENTCISTPEKGTILKNVKIIRENGETFIGGIWEKK
jgi:hypothetical protein